MLPLTTCVISPPGPLTPCPRSFGSKYPDLTFGQALYWSAVTTTTIGYGDYAPTLLASQAMLIGMLAITFTLLPYQSGALLSALAASSRFQRAAYSATLRGRHVVVTGELDAERVARLTRELYAADYGAATGGRRWSLVTAAGWAARYMAPYTAHAVVARMTLPVRRTKQAQRGRAPGSNGTRHSKTPSPPPTHTHTSPAGFQDFSLVFLCLSPPGDALQALLKTHPLAHRLVYIQGSPLRQQVWAGGPWAGAGHDSSVLGWT